MYNLLRSGFFRYTHSTVFWVCTVLTAVFALLFSWNIYASAELNEVWFVFGTMPLSILITFIIGNESSKCIRNKIPTGYTRTQIYLSELILANMFVVFLFSVFLVFSIVLNIRLLPHIPLKLALQTVFGFLCSALLFANVFATMTCIVSHKTISIVIGLALIIALYLPCTGVSLLLDEEEFLQVGTFENDVWVEYEEKNPRYVDEPQRSLLMFYDKVNPYSQRISYDDILRPFLFDDEAWERAKQATANTVGDAFLKREISEDEQVFLNTTPFATIALIPIFVLTGWLVFRKKSFQ